MLVLHCMWGKKNYILTEQKGQIWHFSGVSGKGTSIGCSPWSPNPPASPVLPISPSITESRFIRLSTVTLFHFFFFPSPSVTQICSGGGRVNWIPKTLGPPKQKMCSKHWPALACTDAGALLCERLSAGAEMATAEARWSSWRAAQRAVERRRVWWISGRGHLWLPRWMLKTLQPLSNFSTPLTGVLSAGSSGSRLVWLLAERGASLIAGPSTLQASLGKTLNLNTLDDRPAPCTTGVRSLIAWYFYSLGVV